MMKLKHEPI